MTGAERIETILAEQRCRDVHGDTYTAPFCESCRGWAAHVAALVAAETGGVPRAEVDRIIAAKNRYASDVADLRAELDNHICAAETGGLAEDDSVRYRIGKARAEGYQQGYAQATFGVQALCDQVWRESQADSMVINHSGIMQDLVHRFRALLVPDQQTNESSEDEGDNGGPDAFTRRLHDAWNRGYQARDGQKSYDSNPWRT